MVPEPSPMPEPLPAEVAPPAVVPPAPPVMSAPPVENTTPAFTAPPPPDPPKPTGPTQQDIDAAKNSYSSILQGAFAKHKKYPRLAQMRGWQGIVRVRLEMSAEGAVISSVVSESSGHEILDKQALEMVRKATPLPQPPEILRNQAFTILVPVAFRLE